eukprot:GEZU01013587.1.p1 GENE.GEZU01013587.1~~GEZU01013587.1.p1  ORF type:complete len:256 (-),score=31.94 GEZU01013587.1:192-959(-)
MSTASALSVPATSTISSSLASTNTNMDNTSSPGMDFGKCQTKELLGHKKRVVTLGWNSRGKLASGAETVRVWNIEQNAREVELKGHANHVVCLTWDPSNVDRLGTGSNDKTVKIWDVRQAKCAQTVTTAGENINIAWSPDGNCIAVGNKDDVLQFIDVRMNKIIKVVRFIHEVNEFKWDRSGTQFFVTTSLGTLEIFNANLQKVRSLNAHSANASVFCLDFDPNSKYFATGSTDALTSIWSLPDMICIQSLESSE